MAPSSSQKRKALKASLKSTHTCRKKVVALAAAFSAGKEDFGCSITPAEREQAARKQDDIAEAMWAQYIEYTTNQN
jgi:hypothetical protein